MQSNRLVLASAIAVFALALVSLTSASLYAPSTGIYVASDYCVSPARPYRSYCSSGNAGLYGYACFSRNVKCCGCDYESGSTSYVCYGCDQGDSCPSMYYGQCYESTAPYGRSGLQLILPLAIGGCFFGVGCVIILIRCLRRRQAMRDAETYTLIHHNEPTYAVAPVEYPAGYGTTQQTNYVVYDQASGQYTQTQQTVTYEQPVVAPVAPVYYTGGSATTVVTSPMGTAVHQTDY